MNRWLKLVLAIICLGLPFTGYLMRIYRGKAPAPDVDEWGTLFVDGLKLLVVGIVYILPIMIVIFFTVGLMIIAGLSDNAATSLIAIAANFMLQLAVFVYQVAVIIILPVAYIRFARTGVFAEAFNFSGIFGTIARIGWLNYIVAAVLVSVIISIPICILVFLFMVIAMLGIVVAMSMGTMGLVLGMGILVFMLFVSLVLISPISVFQARYMTRVYDHAVPVDPVSR